MKKILPSSTSGRTIHETVAVDFGAGRGFRAQGWDWVVGVSAVLPLGLLHTDKMRGVHLLRRRRDIEDRRGQVERLRWSWASPLS